MTNKLTLLCVEDDLEALEDTMYLLKRYFSNIYSATNGEDALFVYNEQKPDIILLDINIPKLNGLKVASKIRETDEQTPIIFLSAHSEREKLLKAVNLQVSSYIIKPFKIDELKEVIFKIIKKLDINTDNIELSSDFIWDKNSCELFYQDEKIVLTKNEILLISLLLENKSRFLTVHDVSLEISINEVDQTGNNIVQLISRFKKKVKKQINNDDFFIENTYGSGYRIK